jgi:ATP-dependent helicase HrpB
MPPSRRPPMKVVLATAIAETSLTIGGVRVVIDSGLMRVPRFDPGSGLSRLVTLRVTRDAADQRRGRAGREAAGVCYRLWTRGEDRGLVPHRQPEILEADLAPLALDLAVWGARPDELDWLDPPPAPAFAQAMELLHELDAVDDAGAVTPHGRRIARLGLHPRLGHMILRGADLGQARLACDLAAVLAERDFLRGSPEAHGSSDASAAGAITIPDADLTLRIEALRRPGSTHRGATGAFAPAHVRREADRLRRLVSAADAADAAMTPDSHQVGLLTAFAYPDRIGQRRDGERGRFLLRNGRGARLAGVQTLEGADWLVAADLDNRGAEARIFRAAPLKREDVEEHLAGQALDLEEVLWDPEAGRVIARRRRTLGALTLEEGPLPAPDPAAVAAAVVDGIRQAGLQVLPWDPETRHVRERLRFLHRLDPDAWPDSSDDALMASLEDWLGPFLHSARRLADLRRVDLATALLARVPWTHRARLDELAPERVQVPSGSSIRIDYSDPEAPTLAVRLQEVFGLVETPRVGGGRIPLTMTLLSPARRPVQVTRDMISFWRDAYHQVRKDLRGRYPKHYWPEDPLTAQPTHRTRPRPKD